MARSLNVEEETIEALIHGGTYYRQVTVDGATDNASFTATSYDISDWFSFSIERIYGDVYLKVIVKKNLSTQERHGIIILQHNCAKINKTISIIQDAAQYSITVGGHYYTFNSIPPTDNDGIYTSYEEISVPITAEDGRGKWRVKEIREYQVSKSDNFKDEEYSGISSDDNDSIVQVRTVYDNVFNYRIEGDKLIVRSYGQIDLVTTTHMRYFFVITHSDVDNENKLFLDEMDDYINKKKCYEDKILFVFDNKNGSGGGYGEDDTPAIPDASIPDENIKNYIFTINGGKKHTSNISSNKEILDFVIVSTCNNENVDYNYTIDNGINWVKYNGGNWAVDANETYSDRSCQIIFTQNGSNNIVYEMISQSAMSKSYTFQIAVNDSIYESDFKLGDIDEGGISLTLKVTSTYADDATPYTMLGTYDWVSVIKINDNTYNIKISKNEVQTKRTATFTFTQTNSLKRIYMNIEQKAADNISVFDAYFTKTSTEGQSKERTVDYTYKEIQITVDSTLNGVYAEYEVSVNCDWVAYNKNNGILSVSQYSYTDGTVDERICKITFTREKCSAQILTLTQKRQAIAIHCECDDNITLGWEGKTYDEPYGTIYSYLSAGDVKTPISITEYEIDGDDFITNIEYSEAKEDYKGYYYEVRLTVTTNETEKIKTATVQFTNASGTQCTMKVEQRKNGEIILTSFDYIVMNYYWTDEIGTDGSVYYRDFDCVMYFDTISIGDMYQKCAYFGGKTIGVINDDGSKSIYGELAYDQIASLTTDLNRIETQVIYLLKLQEDGYLQKMKEASEKYLTIQLYGNLFNVENASKSSSNLTTLSIHTYLGGIMERDDTNKTMKNNGGTEVNIGAIEDVTYHITSLNRQGGGTVEILKQNNFQHLGTISYNIRDKSAVFTPVNTQ